MNIIINFTIIFILFSCSSNKIKENNEIANVLAKNYTLKNKDRYIPLWSRDLKMWINKYGKVKNKKKPEVYYFLEEKEISKDSSCDEELKKKLNERIYYEISLYLKENHFEFLLSKNSLKKNDFKNIALINHKLMEEVNKKNKIYRSDKEERVYKEESVLYCRSLSKISRNNFRDIIDIGVKLFKNNNRSPQSISSYNDFFENFDKKYNQGDL